MKLTEITKQLNNDLQEFERFLILPHVMADGDAIGSCLAMASCLESLGKETLILMEEKVPYIYTFMIGSSKIEIYDENKSYDYQVCIVLDTGDTSRLGTRIDLFKGMRTYNIDHHITNDSFADFNYINTQACSTAEIVYDILKEDQRSLDFHIAQALYVGIATDTGGFRYQNTSAKAFQIAAELCQYGISIETISDWVFERTNMNKLFLMKKAISNISLYFDNKVAVIKLKKEDYDDVQVSDEDFEGLVNIAKNIEGVQVGIFIRERVRVSLVKASLRSNTDKIDVSKIAAKFGGGGHSRAAGIASELQIEELLAGILKTLESSFPNT